MNNSIMAKSPYLPADVSERLDELIDDNWWTIDDPEERSMVGLTVKLKILLAQELERQRQEYIEAVEKLKYGQNVIINAVSRSEKAELAEPLLSHNKTLDDVLAILKKARE